MRGSDERGVVIAFLAMLLLSGCHTPSMTSYRRAPVGRRTWYCFTEWQGATGVVFCERSSSDCVAIYVARKHGMEPADPCRPRTQAAACFTGQRPTTADAPVERYQECFGSMRVCAEAQRDVVHDPETEVRPTECLWIH